MCAPLAALPLITMIGAGMSAAAGGVAAYGKIQQDNAQATVAQANAASQVQAEAVDQTNMNQGAMQRYRQIAQVQGQQTTAAAAGGVAVGFGTAGQSVADTALLGSEDVNKIYSQGLQTQRAHDTSITNDIASANADKSNAVMTGIGGALSFGSTILGGATQLSNLQKMMGGPIDPFAFGSH